MQSLYNTAGGSIVCPGAFPFALTRLFFQALNQPIKIHVSSGLCAEGDAARINFEHKQHATRDLLRRLQQQGRLVGQAAGSAAPPAGWPQFGNLTGIEAPVAYVGALQARLVSERSRKRCACGGVGTPRCTHVFEGAPGLSIRRTWAKKKRACKSAHRAWVSSSHQPDLQAHMW